MVAVAPIAALTERRFEPGWCSLRGIILDVRHSARAVEVRADRSRQLAQIRFKTGVLAGVVGVLDVYLGYGVLGAIIAGFFRVVVAHTFFCLPSSLETPY